MVLPTVLATLLVSGLAATGVPEDGFPNWAERTLLVLTNRARADPAAALASCPSGNCPDAKCYSAAPPLVWDVNLNHSARFHVDNLVASASTLQHPSPCLLEPTIASLYPATCAGDPSCACQGGASLCSCDGCSCNDAQASCVTQPFDRIALFSPDGCAENISAGYSDPMATFTGWLTEQCSSWNGSCAAPTQTTCSSTTENGHRFNILDPTNQILGCGSVTDQQDACYPGEWDSQDFGCGVNPTVPKLVAGTHFPQVGSQPTFYVNWSDTLAPASASLDIDGVCTAMTVDRGSGGNATYTATASLSSGCHAYVFEFVDSAGTSWLVPETGAYQAGSSCSADYVATAPAGCAGSGTSGTTTSSGSSTSTSSGTSTTTAGSTATTGAATSTSTSSTGAGSSGASGDTSGGTTAGTSSTSGSSGTAGATSTGTAPSKPAERVPTSGGCGCATSGTDTGALLWAALGVVALSRRRKRV